VAFIICRDKFRSNTAFLIYSGIGVEYEMIAKGAIID